MNHSNRIAPALRTLLLVSTLALTACASAPNPTARAIERADHAGTICAIQLTNSQVLDCNNVAMLNMSNLVYTSYFDY